MSIKIENVVLPSSDQWKVIIMGCRNPKNSWTRSDSKFNLQTTWESDQDFKIGPNDLKLMSTLCNAGTDHRKFMRMIPVYLDIIAPLYFWKEFSTYKVGTVANSCSTMHKIHSKRFEREDFSIEHLENCAYPKEGQNLNGETHWMVCIDNIISSLNVARELFLSTGDKKYWWQMIQLLPSSYNQRRTVMLNYEVLANIYKSRRNHKLDEWVEFCAWIKTLPYSELITGENAE